jgi:hypothetical protein
MYIIHAVLVSCHIISFNDFAVCSFRPTSGGAAPAPAK